MKEKPILLNTEMVRAVLDGRKTQTRRMLTTHHLKMIDTAASAGECHPLESGSQSPNSQSYYREWCPFGAVGDHLWVREKTKVIHILNDKKAFVAYLADGEEATVPVPDRLKPIKPGYCLSNGCYREASRITLEITGVRVDRLNAISQEDAHAEGMELTGWQPTYYDPDSGGDVMTPYDNFAELWSSIYGAESWQANPWVWVIDFKRLEE